jgi:hypothetical protein
LIIHICRNKNDLQSKRAVETEKARNFAFKNDIGYSETSAITGDGIHDMFEVVVNKYMLESSQTLYQSEKQKTPVSNETLYERVLLMIFSIKLRTFFYLNSRILNSLLKC